MQKAKLMECHTRAMNKLNRYGFSEEGDKHLLQPVVVVAQEEQRK